MSHWNPSYRWIQKSHWMTDRSTPGHKSVHHQIRHSESNTVPFVESRSARLHTAVFHHAYQRSEPVPAWRIERPGIVTGRLLRTVATVPRYQLPEPSSVAVVNSSIGVNHFAGVLSDPSPRNGVVTLDVGRIKAISVGSVASDVNDLFVVGLIEADDGPTGASK